MISPCSVPRALRLVIPIETPAQQLICQAHDAAYDAGGSRRERAIADAFLLLGLLETGMSVDLAEQYHVAVRVCGKAHWKNGRYTDELAPASRESATVEAP